LRRGASEATQGDKEERVTLGASYQIVSAVKVFAGYKWFNSSILATAGRSDIYYGGCQFKLRPDFSVSAATYYTDFKPSGQHLLDFGVNTAYL
jgi:predicted porin